MKNPFKNEPVTIAGVAYAIAVLVGVIFDFSQEVTASVTILLMAVITFWVRGRVFSEDSVKTLTGMDRKTAAEEVKLKKRRDE